jgi:hypothetical protein
MQLLFRLVVLLVPVTISVPHQTLEYILVVVLQAFRRQKGVCTFGRTVAERLIVRTSTQTDQQRGQR